MKQLTQETSARQSQTIKAVIHRFLRAATQNEQLAPGEFLALSCCSVGVDELHGGGHDKNVGVYKAIGIGTVYGGSLLQRAASFLRIKLANLKHGYRTH